MLLTFKKKKADNERQQIKNEKKCRKRKANFNKAECNIESELQVNLLVRLFKNAIKEGPYYVCVV